MRRDEAACSVSWQFLRLHRLLASCFEKLLLGASDFRQRLPMSRMWRAVPLLDRWAPHAVSASRQRNGVLHFGPQISPPVGKDVSIAIANSYDVVGSVSSGSSLAIALGFGGAFGNSI